jgi:hypothetical protein
VGSTRITPILEGVTFQRTNARPVIVINPTPPPPVVVVKQAPPAPPETVDVPYPVPVITGIVTLNPPGQPNPQRKGGSAPPAKTVTASNSAPPAKSGERRPGPQKPQSGRQRQFRKPAEYEAASAAIQDVDSRHFSKALGELDTWAQKYSESDFKADRLYYYVLAYNGTGQPGRVLDTAAQLLGGLEKSLEDPRQLIMTLYLTTINIQKLPYPSHDQFTTGQAAARNLLDAVDQYFTDANRPAGTSSDEWRKAQTDLEATARTTLASLASKQHSH